MVVTYAATGSSLAAQDRRYRGPTRASRKPQLFRFRPVHDSMVQPEAEEAIRMAPEQYWWLHRRWRLPKVKDASRKVGTNDEQ